MSAPKSLRWNSVNSQIILAFFTLTILIVALEVVAHAWIVEMLQISSFKDTFSKLQEEQTKMKNAANEFILREKANEKFFENGSSVFIERYVNHLERLETLIGEVDMLGKALGINDQGDLVDLRLATNQYDVIFRQMVEKIKLRGYGRYGLIGEFGKSIDRLVLYEFGRDKMALMKLQLFVKDYLLTGDKAIVKDISDEVYNFTISLEKHVRDEEVGKVTTILYNYESVFKQLVNIDRELGIYSGKGLQYQLFTAGDHLDYMTRLSHIEDTVDAAYARIMRRIYFSFFLIVIATIGAAAIIRGRLYKNLAMPIEKMKSVIASMGRGEVPESNIRLDLDDFNQIAEAINNLVSATRHYQDFANRIGSGNLDCSFTPLSEKDILGLSLLAMRDNLKTNLSEQQNQLLELRRLNAELDNFTYHASHDLRAPLSTIQGLVNIGMKEYSTNTLHSYMKMIKSRVDHMDALLKDLIAISYNNKITGNFQSIEIEREVRSIVSAMIGPGNEVEVSIAVDQGVTFVSDIVRVRAILSNLISNAIKYCNPENEKSRVEITIKVDNHFAIVAIADNGIGIDEQYKEKIFNMFFRASTRSNGSGLGLYIVKSMVERLSGKISVESALDVGTTFYVTLPNEALASPVPLQAPMPIEQPHVNPKLLTC